jgi:hypothetical protein
MVHTGDIIRMDTTVITMVIITDTGMVTLTDTMMAIMETQIHTTIILTMVTVITMVRVVHPAATVHVPVHNVRIISLR